MFDRSSPGDRAARVDPRFAVFPKAWEDFDADDYRAFADEVDDVSERRRPGLSAEDDRPSR